MSKKILQINFNFSVSKAEYEQAVSQLAQQFADLGGLRWKIWIMNDAEREAGGIYLFDDEKSVRAYLEGPLAAQVKAYKALSNLSVKQFDVMDELTGITRGPC